MFINIVCVLCGYYVCYIGYTAKGGQDRKQATSLEYNMFIKYSMCVMWILCMLYSSRAN